MQHEIRLRLERVRTRIENACARSGRDPGSVTLVGVTKGVTPDLIREGLAAGLRDIGENRVQEAQAKREGLTEQVEAITWHLLGHLQTNKVRPALELFDIIHSVDSIHLAEAISRRAPQPVSAFLEVNAGGEPTKGGFSLDELGAAYERISALPNLPLQGLMTVAPIASDPARVRPVFQRLRLEAERLGLGGLSMGMSDDFEVAVEEGATHVRIGRAIFGERRAA